MDVEKPLMLIVLCETCKRKDSTLYTPLNLAEMENGQGDLRKTALLAKADALRHLIAPRVSLTFDALTS